MTTLTQTVQQCHFQQYFTYIMATNFSGGRSRSTRREPPTMGKQLVNFITCGCELRGEILLKVALKHQKSNQIEKKIQ
jgi:hypothetical protein